MTDKNKDEATRVCELCKKEVKEKDGAFVLGGTAFECKKCAGNPKEHEHGNNDDGVCKFC